MENKFVDRLNSLLGGLSGNAFARKCGIKQTTMNGYLNGLSEPNRENLVKIARACNVTVGWLADGEGEAQSVRPGKDQEEINIAEGRLMTDLVLMSGTQYAEALWSNLNSFAEAVRKEAQVKELEKKMDLLLDKVTRMEEREAARDSATPEKRDKTANA